MDVKILGTGCPKCAALEATVRKVVEKHGIDATVSKVEDIVDIMNYGVMMTPALVVDGKVLAKGRIPDENEILSLLNT